MKHSLIKRIWKEHLAQHLPGSICVRDLILYPPIRWLIRGYCFEGSSSGKFDCYVWCFVMPLFDRTDGVTFNFGDRIFSPTIDPEHEADAATKILTAMRTKGEPFLIKIHAPSDIIAQSSKLINPTNLRQMENLAMCYIAERRYKEAITLLENVYDMTIKDYDHMRNVCEQLKQPLPLHPFQLELLERTRKLEGFCRNDPESAVNELREMRGFTLDKLKLQQYADIV